MTTNHLKDLTMRDRPVLVSHEITSSTESVGLNLLSKRAFHFVLQANMPNVLTAAHIALRRISPTPSTLMPSRKMASASLRDVTRKRYR